MMRTAVAPMLAEVYPQFAEKVFGMTRQPPLAEVAPSEHRQLPWLASRDVSPLCFKPQFDDRWTFALKLQREHQRRSGEGNLIEPTLRPETIKIKQLVGDYRSGRVVIPEFQREYVWKPSKAPFLIDSIYRGFPISSLLLWQSTEEVRARRRDPRPSRGTAMSWLIDGQQRVITLSRVMNGDEGIDIVFHPENDEFRLSNAATRNDRNWFRVAELLAGC
jgi:hypothetical protein